MFLTLNILDILDMPVSGQGGARHPPPQESYNMQAKKLNSCMLMDTHIINLYLQF